MVRPQAEVTPTPQQPHPPTVGLLVATYLALLKHSFPMGALGATIYFTATPPTVLELLAALREHTGETASYDEETQFLACPDTNDTEGFIATRHICQHIWEPDTQWSLLNFNLKGGYLWFAALIVLQRLGGACDWKVPSWAFKPWHLAQYEQKRWFVRRYTFDEARRLGVE